MQRIFLGGKVSAKKCEFRGIATRGTTMARQIILFALSAAIVATSPASAQPRSTGPEKTSAPAASCDEFLPARKQVGGKNIGPDECRILFCPIDEQGRKKTSKWSAG